MQMRGRDASAGSKNWYGASWMPSSAEIYLMRRT